jgi:type VI secretion system secreted protein Hcp
MKRFLWAGAIVLVAVVAAVPLWLAQDDDDGRRAGALVTPSATGADIGRLTLVGKVSGTVTLAVRSFDVEVKTPLDTVSGQRAGAASYKPLEIIKPINATTAGTLRMLVGNEQISTAKLELIRPDPATGQESVYMTYDFTNAAVSSWRNGTRETISLHYQSITSSAGKALGTSASGAIGRMTYGTTVVPITDFDTNILSPRDPATGQASGKRQHKPVSVVRAIDSLAPKTLADVKTPPAPFPVKVELLRTSPKTGLEEVYATYRYGGVVLAAVDDSAAAGGAATQRIEFSYQTIEVDIEKSVASDSWAAPQA